MKSVDEKPVTYHLDNYVDDSRPLIEKIDEFFESCLKQCHPCGRDDFPEPVMAMPHEQIDALKKLVSK